MAKFKDILSEMTYQKYFFKINGMMPIKFNEFLPKSITVSARLERVLELTFSAILVHIFILYGISFLLSFGKSLDEITGALTGTIIFGYSSFISIYVKVRRQQFLGLLDYIGRNLLHKSASGFTEIEMTDAYKKADKLSKGWGLVCLIGVVTMTFSPLLMGKRDLPLKVWYPFDEKAKYVFEILYVIQFIGQIQMSLSFSNTSGMYLVFVIMVCSQFDVLFCSIKNFVVTTELASNSDQKRLKDLESFQSLSNDEAQQYLYSIERKSSNTEKIRDIVAMKKSTYYENSERELIIIHGLRDALARCVEHHLFILNVAKKVENFFAPVCFVKNLQITIQLCLLGFVMIKSTDQDNAVIRLITLFQYLSLTITELLILTYFGEMITTQSLRLPNAFMRSHWFLYSTHVKQDILIILQNAVRPVVLTAGKIINLDIERFRLSITTAFSFITLLQKLDARN